MKRLELKSTVRYFAANRPQGFADDTRYIAHEADGQSWHITKHNTRTKRTRGLQYSLQCERESAWKEVTLPDSVLFNTPIARR